MTGKRTSPRVLDGSQPRRSTRELRETRLVQRDLARTLARGVRVSAVARVAGVPRSQVYKVLRAAPEERVTLGTQGALLEALIKIDGGEVTLGARDLRAPGVARRQPVGQRAVACVRDHALEGDNVYLTPDGRRQCRTCQREARRRYRQRGGS